MSRSLYRALIELHPARFRHRFGDEMLSVFDEAGRERAPRLFIDAVLSLLRQWLLRSNLWKMAGGAVISSLLLFAWRNSTARGVDLSLAAASRSNSVLSSGVSRSPGRGLMAQAVAILAEIRKTEAQKLHVQPHDAPRFAPNPSSSTHANKG
jgi:hypothetical protein